MKLSILANAYEGCCTYYTGYRYEDVAHLEGLNCTLVCGTWFSYDIPGVSLIKTDHPQKYFYDLTNKVEYDYLEWTHMLNGQRGVQFHAKAKIDGTARIGPNTVIGEAEIHDNVEIGANVTIYGKTVILPGARIGSGSTIGSDGMMWCDDEDSRVRIKLLGNVVIGRDTVIGDNCVIVRGSANETTSIGDGTFVAPGTNIGHGAVVGPKNHIANNVSLGGSCKTGTNVFLGCGSTMAPGVFVADDCVVGAGSTVTKDCFQQKGVYVGSPAVWKKNTETKMRGVPQRAKD